MPDLSFRQQSFRYHARGQAGSNQGFLQFPALTPVSVDATELDSVQ